MTTWVPGPAWLFCPADRADRYVKALTRSDVVILDLEDAVAPAGKERARKTIGALAAEGRLDLDRTVVRVNAATTSDHAADLAIVAETGIHRVMLAKAEHAQEIASINADVVPLLETPRGVERAGLLAEPANVIGLMWGADDLVAGLGGSSSRRPDGTYRDVARFARERILLAAKASDRMALDAVHMDIDDLGGLRAECEDAVAEGFDATVAIHPKQVAVIRQAYLPTSIEISWANRLLRHVGEDRGVTTFEGRMVDGPIYRQAERILRRAETASIHVT